MSYQSSRRKDIKGRLFISGQSRAWHHCTITRTAEHRIFVYGYMNLWSSQRKDIKGRPFLSHVFKDELHLSVDEMIQKHFLHFSLLIFSYWSSWLDLMLCRVAYMVMYLSICGFLICWHLFSGWIWIFLKIIRLRKEEKQQSCIIVNSQVNISQYCQ